MRGLKKKSQKFKFFVLLASLGHASAFLNVAVAHVPYPGQVLRFQPSQLRNQKAFSVDMQAATVGLRFPGELRWYGSGEYDVRLNLPRRFHRQESEDTVLLLQRRGSACVLQAYSLTVRCPEARSWALMEFSTDVNALAAKLVEEGFMSAEDTRWIETDSRKEVETPNNSVRLALGSNGSKPLAAIEIAGGARSSGGIFSFGQSSEPPLLHFDQSFHKALHARFRDGSDVIRIHANANLEVSREQSRYSHILASQIQVFRRAEELATFMREERKDIAAAAAKAPPIARSEAELSTLEAALSSHGRSLLQALLYTH